MSNHADTVLDRVKFWENMLQKRTSTCEKSEKQELPICKDQPQIRRNDETNRDTNLKSTIQVREEETQRFISAKEFLSQMKMKYGKESKLDDGDETLMNINLTEDLRTKSEVNFTIKNYGVRNCLLLKNKQSGCSFWIPNKCNLDINIANPGQVSEDKTTEIDISKLEQTYVIEKNCLRDTNDERDNRSQLDEDIPCALPFCEKEVFLESKLNNEKFYHSVEVAKSALARAIEIDNFIVEKIWKLFADEYGTSWIQDVVILVACLNIES